MEQGQKYQDLLVKNATVESIEDEVSGRTKTEELLTGEFYQDSEAIAKLSQGLLRSCIGDQEKVKKMLADVTESQRVILETLQQENAKFTECQIMREVVEIMAKAKVYHQKLLNIKKEMLALHEKSTELKRRAVRIQQEKQKEALLREQQREREMEKELRLTARMAKPQ